jgi:hypothetical protein
MGQIQLYATQLSRNIAAQVATPSRLRSKSKKQAGKQSRVQLFAQA